MKELPYKEFSELRTNSMRLIDVREVHEFEVVHVPGAELFPLSQIQRGERPTEDEREIFIICRSGARSAFAASLLEQEGFRECTNISDGTVGAMMMGMDKLVRG